MKKTYSLFIFALTLLCSADGIAGSSDSSSTLADSLVWKISGPDLAEPSYLAGTLHLMCQQDYTADPRHQLAINNTRQLYLELDFDDAEDMAVLEQAMFTDESLKDRLSAIQYQQLTDYLNTHTKLKIEMLDKMSFMAIQTTLLLGHLNCPVKSVDLELSVLAKSSGQQVHGLETAAQQIKITEVFIPTIDDDPWTVDELDYYLGDIQTFSDMLKLYQHQDITGLYQYVTRQIEQMADSDHIQSTILDERNKNWVAQMPGIMQSKPTFFAVGSGHLAGQNGLINLLRQAGYTVQAVKL
jgi:uncharacterized protein YbaP (TraB family)